MAVVVDERERCDGNTRAGQLVGHDHVHAVLRPHLSQLGS
jgi:hypothetical protein